MFTLELGSFPFHPTVGLLSSKVNFKPCLFSTFFLLAAEGLIGVLMEAVFDVVEGLIESFDIAS